MKQINRIKANKDFALTIKKGKCFKSASYVIHICNNELNHTRVGISVSKKIGNAVTRNKIKRQVRSMVDVLIDCKVSSKDMVIVVRKEYLSNAFETNKTLLNELVKNRLD